jgi:3',5'-cyclic AMP phosphodiesterase CpdA
MEHKIKIAAIIILTLFFSACNYADLGGIFISDESVNQRFEQSMEWNSQNPFKTITVTVDEYTILTASDIHVGGTTNLDIFIEDSKTISPAAVVMVGDLASGQVEDFDVFKQHIANFDTIPYFTVAGNHDLYFEGWNEFFPRFGSSTYYFTVQTPVDKDLFICLDSGGGTIGTKQLEWFEDVLINIRPNYRRCVVLTHNNFFRFRRTTSTNPNVEEVRLLLELFTKNNVDLAITGHDHVKDEQTFGNTIHIVMDALKDETENAGYFQFNIKNGNIDYKFVNL